MEHSEGGQTVCGRAPRRDQLIGDIEFQMVAVGTHHRFENPMIRRLAPNGSRLEHNFLRRVALRFVKNQRPLGLAEIRDAVIADRSPDPKSP